MCNLETFDGPALVTLLAEPVKEVAGMAPRGCAGMV